MIDAYTIGITLALDNGVSEGLATIRRDLVALNGVVENSATRLKDLTHAAAHLRVGPDAPGPIQESATAPTQRHAERPNPAASYSPPLDPALFAPSGLDLLKAANPLLSTFSVPVPQSIADVGQTPANQPSMTSLESRTLAPSVPSPALVANQQSSPAVTIAEFAPARYLAPMLASTLPLAAAGDESGSGGRLNSGDGMSRSTITDTRSPLAPLNQQDSSIPLAGEPSAQISSLPQVPGSWIDHSPGTPGTRHDASAADRSPGVDATAASAVPPPTESQLTTSHGDIYVDGSRLGRWMTDRLANAAERPRAAMTGFDTRMTPTWPGSPVGA